MGGERTIEEILRQDISGVQDSIISLSVTAALLAVWAERLYREMEELD